MLDHLDSLWQSISPEKAILIALSSVGGVLLGLAGRLAWAITRSTCKGLWRAAAWCVTPRPEPPPEPLAVEVQLLCEALADAKRVDGVLIAGRARVGPSAIYLDAHEVTRHYTNAEWAAIRAAARERHAVLDALERQAVRYTAIDVAAPVTGDGCAAPCSANAKRASR